MPILDVNKLHLKSVAMHWNFFFLVVGIPKFLILAPPLIMIWLLAVIWEIMVTQKTKS